MIKEPREISIHNVFKVFPELEKYRKKFESDEFKEDLLSPLISIGAGFVALAPVLQAHYIKERAESLFEKVSKEEFEFMLERSKKRGKFEQPDKRICELSTGKDLKPEGYLCKLLWHISTSDRRAILNKEEH